MALRFLTSSDMSIDIVVTCDDAVECTEAQRSQYLETGELGALDVVRDDATRFNIKALSPAEREQAEANAGALTRSELGRLLWSEAPDNTTERAKWHHGLDDDERVAMSEYQQYLNRVYVEMIRAALVSIDGDPADDHQLQMIRRIQMQNLKKLLQFLFQTMLLMLAIEALVLRLQIRMR